MYCKICGAEISDTQPIPTVCPVCKHSLNEDKTSDETVETTEEITENEETSSEEPSEQELVEESKETAPTNLSDSSGDEPKKPSGSSGKIIALIVAAIAIAAIIIILSLGNKPVSKQTITSLDHSNPTFARFTNNSGVGFAKKENVIQLYTNDAVDINSHATITQMLTSGNPYIGKRNFVEFDNGNTVYISSTITGVDQTTGQPDMTGILYEKKKGQEAVKIDDNVQTIYCSNSTTVFYNKAENDSIVQYRYDSTGIKSTKEVTGLESSVITSVSDDGNVLSLVELTPDGQIGGSGYMENGNVHMLDNYSVSYVSKDGKIVYAAELNENQMVNLSYVKDLTTASLELLGTNITEMMPYEDDGSIIFVGDCDPMGGKGNPLGNVYLFDSAAKSTSKIAENVTAVLEALPRPYAWMNEDGMDIQSTETAGSSYPDIPTQLYKGQIHYINADGNFAVSSAENKELVIGESIYDSEQYSLSQDLYFFTKTKDYIFWNKGDTVYRYKLGSMATPESIKLDKSMDDKANSGETLQVGYITVGSGDIIEEISDTIVLKKFDKSEPITILENVGAISVIGIDNDGENIYFISQDKSLYSKSIATKNNPKRLASNIYSAVITTDGLYYIQDFVDNEGGTLYYQAYGEKAISIATKVQALSSQGIAE